jgi:hypothetical protein
MHQSPLIQLAESLASETKHTLIICEINREQLKDIIKRKKQLKLNESN